MDAVTDKVPEGFVHVPEFSVVITTEDQEKCAPYEQLGETFGETE